MSADFSDLQADFLRITAGTVFCTATTVSEEGRPRSRMLHPIFVVRDGRPIGWALTGRTPLKTRHLAANPHMSCSYWTPSHDTVFIDCVATWVEDDREKEQVWELFRDTPEPLGWGPEGWRATDRTSGAIQSSRRCDWSRGASRSCAETSTPRGS
jgi:general stress protein 26